VNCFSDVGTRFIFIEMRPDDSVTTWGFRVE
jgi:hypothetical protein